MAWWPAFFAVLAAMLFSGAAAGEGQATEDTRLAESFAELLDAKRWPEAEADAQARMAADPTDTGAGADLAQVILLSDQRDRQDEAIGLLEKAIEAKPGNARYYFLIGRFYGAKARSAGMGVLSLAGKSKHALARAVELEPESFEYYYALNEYYLEAPFIAGGGVGKARKTAQEFTRVDPDGGAMLTARILNREKEFEKALSILRTLKRRNDGLYDPTRRNLLSEAAMGLIDHGRAAAALPVFLDVTGEFPNNAVGHLGLGRARLETGDVARAVQSLCRSLEIARRLETLYHLGIAYQAAGKFDDARLVLIEAEQAARGTMADDIRRRLASLGG